MEIREIVYKLIKEEVVNDVNVNDEALLKEELGIDSFKAVNLLYRLQENGLTLKSYNIEVIITVKDLIKALKHE